MPSNGFVWRPTPPSAEPEPSPSRLVGSNIQHSLPSKEDSMPWPRFWSAPILVLIAGLAGSPGALLQAQTAVADSTEFAAWRQVQKEDIDGLRKKFMALAQAVPADKLGSPPMDGTRSFREVFAHVAAEGNTETAMFGRPLPAGSVADFDAEEVRLKKLPDDQLIAAMDGAMRSLSATMEGLSSAKINTPIRYYGQ